ncbi:DM13 domain-containing protein [Nocardia yamanashiensis]|uniref:DM13 domain-containing protein n=1 Tax=Nocardia yamanashiensis TaxID=209247 RepID=UPI001E5C2CEE|nr:DM13 domain-containing protein [Nocardia yamanashiensis]UGT44473.1 DM13 domain-containing protein [Nocardia yamanashiensis]
MAPLRRIAPKPVVWTLTGLAVVAVVIGLALFQPWRLFTSTTVDEALPTVAVTTTAAPAGAPAVSYPRTLYTGTLISHEHETTGTVSVLELADRTRVLRLENLDTSDGPALHVFLSDAAVLAGKDGWGVFDDGQHLDLGKLKGNKGNQNYDIPVDTDLTALHSLSIWCDRFNVSFGAAELRAA